MIDLSTPRESHVPAKDFGGAGSLKDINMRLLFDNPRNTKIDRGLRTEFVGLSRPVETRLDDYQDIPKL